MSNIWRSLKKPIFILAPMENVTDTVFRQIIAGCGRPDLFFTEFTNVDGILSKGKEFVTQRLNFHETERPIIAQIWGTNPKNFFEAVKVIYKMGFDGIDINMGCPVRDVIKDGACGNLIKTPELAAEIIKATKAGILEAAGNPDKTIPISVKTRIGIKEAETEKWIGHLLKQNLDAITIHARLVKEMSKYPANWEEIAKAVKLRDRISPQTVIIGNGDVLNYQDGLDKIKKYKVDGVMLGRAVFDNPWVFNKDIDIAKITVQQRLDLLVKHVELYAETWKSGKRFDVLKKFFKIYINSFDGASNLREKLMKTSSLSEVHLLIDPMRIKI